MNKNIFTGAILALFLAISIYVSGVFGGAQFIVSLTIYGLIFYGCHILWSKIRKKDIMGRKEFILYFANRIGVFLLVVVAFFGTFIYYENIYEPALLPEFTLSNGDKTVVFQGMAHIGSDNFYNTVIEHIKEYKNKGFVLFFEGVKPGTKESSDKFNKLLGVKFDKQTYVNLSKIYGLRAQNNKEFLGLVNDKDYNVDVGMDEIVANYEKKYGKINDKVDSSGQNIAPVSVDALINEITSDLTPRELTILKAVNRSLMNFIVKNNDVQNVIKEEAGQKDLFDIILNGRNKTIVEAIEKSENKKIIILYGLMHFEGVWSQLQQHDTKWKLINIRYLKPID